MIDLGGKKQFEKLDTLTQMIEPLEWEGLELLSSLPDKYKVTYEDIKKIVNEIEYGIDTHDLLRVIAGDNVKKYNERDVREVFKCFILQSESEEITVDFEAETLDGEVFLVKQDVEFKDEDLLHMIAVAAADIDTSPMYRSQLEDEVYIDRINDVIDVLAPGSDRKDKKRSLKFETKRQYLSGLIKTSIGDKTWNVRSSRLALNISKWIVDYAVNNNKDAISNLIKFKLMTHSGLPLYSLENDNE